MKKIIILGLLFLSLATSCLLIFSSNKADTSDFIIVNSDGLTNMVSVEDIRDIVLSEVALESKVETLIRFANNAGGLDNITVALLHITEEAH